MITFDDTEDKDNQTSFMRKIKHGVDITFKNNKCITPIIFEFTVSCDNKQVNIFDHHKKIFEAMKLVDNSTKMITIADKVLEHPKETLSGQEYVTNFPFINSIKTAQGFRLLQRGIGSTGKNI